MLSFFELWISYFRVILYCANECPFNPEMLLFGSFSDSDFGSNNDSSEDSDPDGNARVIWGSCVIGNWRINIRS